MAELSVRRSIGLPRAGSVSDLIWLRAEDSDGEPVYVGVEGAYVYERTGMLVNARIAAHNNPVSVPVFDIMTAVLYELEPVLGFQTHELIHADSLPEQWRQNRIDDYLALDHKHQCKLILVGAAPALNRMEVQAKTYCSDYWARHEAVGRQILLDLRIGIYPLKRRWSALELADVEVGDLLALQQLQSSNANTRSLRGYLRLCGVSPVQQTHEVLIHMNDNDTTLQFSGELDHEPRPVPIEMDVPAHEQIELEIYAGRTRIPFGELCAVQAGTLIELGEHSLPMLTLCVNGSAILEGELVHFKDQLMVQVTKRLE